MSRRSLIRTREFPYHLTGRCNNREMFHCGIVIAWDIFLKELQDAEALFGIKIHAFVLMPNHFHLLLTTPQEDLDVVMHRFILSVTKSINIKSGRTGRVFGGRYHWSLVNTMAYYDHVTKYIYRNPVKAGLCTRVEEYSYSTINVALGSKKINFFLHPLEEELIPNNDAKRFLNWLNQPFVNKDEDAIRRALRKTKFLPMEKGWKRKVYCFTEDYNAPDLQK